MFRFKYIAVALVIFAASASAVFAYTSPGKPTGFVNDFAKIMSQAQAASLEAKLSGFEKSTGAEISVVTVTSLGGDTVDNFAAQLFQEWGIGKKGADNGLLILVAPNDQEARIEVGYGLEPTITDAVSSVMINSVMIPAFKTGDYYGGLDKATDEIIGIINNDPEVVKTVSAQESQDNQGAQQQMPLFVPILIFVIFLILVSTKWGRKVLFYFFITGMFRGGNNNGKGGFGGGGFGGFGGGSSGGGGASGRW